MVKKGLENEDVDPQNLQIVRGVLIAIAPASSVVNGPSMLSEKSHKLKLSRNRHTVTWTGRRLVHPARRVSLTLITSGAYKLIIPDSFRRSYSCSSVR